MTCQHTDGFCLTCERARQRASLHQPCPSCLEARTFMRVEAIQPLPEGAMAPMGLDGKKQCHDCASAGTVMRLHGLTWVQARIAVANDRQEQLRMPGIPMGLVGRGLVRPSEEGDLDRHHQWLRDAGLMDDEGT